ncbi:MAG: dephospho-CoA kinase [Hyphomicrobiaceae bacterium]|nr:dephospho-CoA kinase [Hyphomicrobiaceae bacterium]
MLIIGLTGSIGMGKSTAAARFIEHGIPVFDADREVHRLYDGKAAPLIEKAFPGTTRDGRVDRALLSARLLGNPDALEQLESIIHPLVREARERFLVTNGEAGAEMAVLEIPLLFEVGADKQVDVSIVVSAPADVQRTRVLGREGMTEAKLEALLSNQMPDDEKRSHADFVVDTDRPVEETAAEIDRLIESLRGREGRVFRTAARATPDTR